jgi:tripartite-type tricarboxylate transporter receptor subunit TctC
MKRFTLRSLIVCVLSLLILAGFVNTALGETDWPKKPITVIIPYSPGGDTDFNARAIMKYLNKELGASVVGSNVVGGGGTIASRQVKDASPDGYTVLFSHTVMLVNEMIGTADFGLDAFDIPCVCARGAGEIIAMRTDSGIKSLDDLKAHTEANPDQTDLAINFGTMVNINGIQMQEDGISVRLVDVGGASERVAALAGGHTDIIINAYGNIKDYLETGDFVALATIGTVRSEGFPEIPTALEQGYGITLDKHYFFAFPKGTDPAILEKFAAAVKRAVENPEYQKDVMTAYCQEPFYAEQAEGLKILQGTKDIIWTYKEKIGK